MKCPVSEFSYSVKTAEDVFKAKELKEEHVAALHKRCVEMLAQIQEVQNRLNVMSLTPDPTTTEEEDKSMKWLAFSDESSPDDSSDDDLTDHTAFESTPYARQLKMLLKLKAFRDARLQHKATLLANGKKINAEWVTDSWQPPEGSPADLKAKAAVKRREKRQAERAERRAAIKKGSEQVVHNIHVLNKQVPKKWAQNNPYTPKAPDWEEKERAKQGWLTEAETEELDEEAAEALTAKRKAEWRAGRSAVPKMPGSVNKQRWAERLYKLSRRQHYITDKVNSMEDPRQKQLWQKRLDDHTGRVELTQAKINTRIEQVSARGDNERKKQISEFFVDAKKIGENEIAAEIEAKRKEEEEAKKKAEEEAEAARKAEAKAKAKAEAEARGEEYVDPDVEKEGGEEEED